MRCSAQVYREHFSLNPTWVVTKLQATFSHISSTLGIRAMIQMDVYSISV